MGGSYNVYGDNGKFGMACVSWFWFYYNLIYFL
jgi:hypothetical protein